MILEAFLAEKSQKTKQALLAYLDQCDGIPDELDEAIRYSLFAGGKFIRPILSLGAAEMVSGDDAVALPVACAMEMIHTYSLIHDDLPYMDDDNLRRGLPTLHVAYGDAMALLAGDSLLTMAFGLLGSTGDAGLVTEVAHAVGASGMIAGQTMDHCSEGVELDVDTLKKIHAQKTGSLIRISIRSGARVAGASEKELSALTSYGESIGLAFQIIDDLLDVIGNVEELGKTPGSDAARGKATFPALIGMEKTRSLAERTVDDAVKTLAVFGGEADPFRELARYVIERTR
jgi:geranylgeranyl diphosphate synthase type II